MSGGSFGEMVDVPTPDGTADSYLARPTGDGPFPAVLFISDAFGLRDRIYEMAERVAAEGYVVLAPNIFYRSGRTPVFGPVDLSNDESRKAFFEKFGPIRASTLTPEAIRSSGGAYLDYLQDLDDVRPGHVAVTGYCMGGVLGWQIAADHPDRVAALGGWHTGNLVTDEPDSPHLRAGELKAEIVFGFADQDHSATAEQIATLEQAMSEAGLRYTSNVFKGAAHGYSMSDAAVYDEAAAERHFTELFALLDRTIA